MLINIATLFVQTAYFINFCLFVVFLFGRINAVRFMSLLFFIMAFVPFQFELIYTKDLFYHPHFFLTYIPPILWFGPIFYIFLNQFIFGHMLSISAIAKHLLIPVLSIFAIIPLLLTPSDDKIALINTLYYEHTSFEFYFVSFLCTGSILFYTWLIFQILPTIRRAKTKNNLFFIMFSMTMIGIIFSTVGFASLLTHSLDLLFWGNVFFSVIIITCYCLHIRFDAFLPELIDEIIQTKVRQSYLSGVNVNRALANLNYLMNTEKIYIDPSLNLSLLAEKINLSPHQLSELINHEVGVNFNTYIMSFRVKAAIKYLKKEPDKTILGIALSVGFNSNSAFYSAFKKITGKSPSDYREEL
tara:strand:+ start:1248 stop:2318 length:1071 start_codon:yes stop_codon:yes gene_type:complete